MERRQYFKDLISEEEYAQIVRYETFPAMLDAAAERFGGRTAVLWEGGARTYGELFADAAAARGALQGAQRNVGIFCGNDYGLVNAFFGAVTAGKTAVLLPAGLPAEAVCGCIKKYDIGLLVYGAALGEAAKKAAAMAGIEALCADGLQKAVPAPMAQGLNKTSPAAVLFSGGTTGKPKGALLSHGALLLGAYNGCFAKEGVTMGQRYLSLIPMTHVFGLVRNLLTCLITGSSIYLCPDMRQMFAAMAAARPTIMVLVPALADMFYRMAKARGVGVLGGELRAVICGGAAVNADLPAKLAQIGVDLFPGYGLTETANLVSGNGSQIEKPSSVGMPYADQQLRVENGELWVKGDHIMTCYYNDPAETAAAMEDGWFKTGDLARFDEEGFLYIVGRTKNIIVAANGENVYPEELEALLNASPLVRDSLVFEAKAPLGSTMLAAELLPDADAAREAGVADIGAALGEWFAKVNAGLPEYKRMARLTVRDKDFDRSPSMKIIRPNKTVE